MNPVTRYKNLNPVVNREEWLKVRLEHVTSTEVSALFNKNPYSSHYELWHEKKNKVPLREFQMNDLMKWGIRLEAIIAKGAARDRGWKIEKMDDFIGSVEKIGSSYDYWIPEEQAILEIKNVNQFAFNKLWTEKAMPAQIELQVQQQMLCSGLDKAYVAVLVGGNDLHIYERPVYKKITYQIMKKCDEFWKTINENKPPEFDFERDAELINELYKDVAGGTVIEPTKEITETAELYNKFSQIESDAKKKKQSQKAKLLTLMGDNERVDGENFSIPTKWVEETQVEAFTRKAYRSFRVNFKKEK